MRVYLDNCCYNRPFDEQSQAAIKLESEAKLLIQALMRAGDYTEWRKEHLFVGETVDSLMDEAEALYGETYDCNGNRK